MCTGKRPAENEREVEGVCACCGGSGVQAHARVRVCAYVCGVRGEREGDKEGVARRLGKYGGNSWAQRTMLGSDETRRTAANCRRTLLFAMRPLKGHTITASMRTSARSATAAQNGAKCQLGSAASIVVILAVAGSREDRGSAVGSNRSGSKESLSVMGARLQALERYLGFRGAHKIKNLHALTYRQTDSQTEKRTA